jgi:hypothetical protein
MINELIQYLKSSKTFGNKFKSNDTKFIFLTSGGYRKNTKSRIVLIIFNNSQPILVIKFYKSPNSLSNEFKIQNKIHDIYGNLISKPLCEENFDGYNLLIEEPVTGKNLTRYVYENLNQNSLIEIFTTIFNFYETLNSNLESSNIENFNKEIELLFEKFYSNYTISQSHKDMIKNLKLEFIKNFENKTIFQRFSNCDFILNNFIINDNKIILTDFEFAKKTHLYFLDWLQFFRYQWIVSNDYLYDLINSKISDKFFNLGLKEFSNYRTNKKFDLSCRLIYEISDFTKRFSVSSPSTCKSLIFDMDKLLDELNFRCENLNIQPKKHDLTISENEFFKKEYQKLTNKNKNSSISEFMEIQRKLEDQLNFREESFRKLEFDHKIYKNNVENSIIWKFVRLLDKLLHKN